MRAFPHSRAASFFIIRVCSGPLIFQRCLHLSTDLEQIGPGLLGAPQDGLHLFPLLRDAAETSAASVILAASHLGIPVSTTHNISAAIMGVGTAKRLNAIRWSVVHKMIWAWILTIPMSGAIAYALFRLMRNMGWA